MKILLLCHEYPPLGGGGGIGAQQYAEAWSEQGHRVTVITSWQRGLKRKETLNGAHIVRVWTIPIKSRATFSFKSMFFYLCFALLHILWYARAYRRYDVINTHFALPDGVLGMVASRLLRLPNILTIIGGDIYDPTKNRSPHRSALTRMINSFVMNAADRIIAISSDTKRNAERFYRVKKEIEIINYGFLPPRNGDADLRIEVQSEKYSLIAIGRLVERKGFEYLIRAMAKLPEDIVLDIIGDGPLEAALRALGNEHDLNGRVRLLGYVPREKVYAHLQSADCFVLSSLHEGLGIVVQEAMYAGLPIVSTSNGGQVDLIENYRNGILVNPGEVEPLADAIRELYTNRDLARAVARNNRKDIEQYFMSVNAQKYIGLFEALARNGSTPFSEVEPILPVQSPSDLD
jgi:glycosyltransferase involved in cell wall biosynthesis